MNARQFITIATLASLVVVPSVAQAKGPAKSFGNSISNGNHATHSVSPRNFVSGGSGTTFKARLPQPITQNLTRTKSSRVRPLGPFSPLNKSVKPHPIVKPLPMPSPGPIVQPYPLPQPKPFPKPFPKPVPTPCPKPFPLPCPKPCPGPICHPWPRPFPYPIFTPCPVPCPQPVCQPYPIVTSQPIIVTASVVETTAAVELTDAQVAAAAAPESLPTITAGQRSGLPGPGLGDRIGTIVVQVAELTLKCSVEKWDTNEVVFVAPDVVLSKAVRATLIVTLADGSLFAEVPVMLLPATAIASTDQADTTTAAKPLDK